jgi:hypothetical protein
MPPDEDPYGKQYDESDVMVHREYELEFYDRDSIDEVKRMLELGRYTDRDMLRDHMEYVENLLEKLSRISMEEKRAGTMNLSLDRDIQHVRALYAQMSMLLDRLEGY